ADYLDDGTKIQAKIIIKSEDKTINSTKAIIDFSGTDDQHENDTLNAALSVTKSAVLYVLKVITGVNIPLNSGCLFPVEIIIPEKSILNPAYPAPVATGNVETSQRIVDVLLALFKVAAASQGTMNNFLFEIDGDTPYYETIAGGSGATETNDGATGVQVHMTNTRITDPEILEHRHPGLRLKQFSIRKHSGGKGKHNGGDGLIREFEFIKPANVSILSERRKYAPYGLNEGQPGKCGENILIKENGAIEKLPHRITTNISPGESIIIKTPGGGGTGKPS
ncbi:MAG: hydantoinase B/oxoprolinase family protein, partial [Vampirovibrionia bacterium]